MTMHWRIFVRYSCTKCADGFVESVADLRDLFDVGKLDEVFQQGMLRGMVSAALEKTE